MKPSMALKPLVFAIAAVMAVAVQAGQNDRRGNHHHNGGHHTPPAKMIPISATANAHDRQSSTNNRIWNEGVENSAEMSSSAQGASGNVGVNVAAGNGNQQDNAAAIANAASDNAAIDNSFVFGTATASADVRQTSNRNVVHNFGVTNSAVMSGSADGSSGNVGVNIAGGDLNQQKNTMAIANTNAPLGSARATASANQDGPGLIVNNTADRTYRVDTITVTKTASGSASREKSFEASGSQSASSSWAAAGSKNSSSSGSFSLDASGSNSSAASGSNSSSASGSSSASLNASLDASLDAAAASSHSTTVNNGWGDRTRSRESDASLTASLSASLDVSVDKSYDKSRESSFDRSRESSFDKSLDVSYDKSRESSYDKSRDSSFEKSFDTSFEKANASSYDKSGSKSSESEYAKAKSWSESSSYDLSNTYSYQVLTPTGWANPVTNTATLSGSVNGGSGNLGVNVAAGVGNQQSNSLAISNQSF
ncbi:heme utilization protein [Pseudomonas umsongensis]|uniref:heme utilization protein n=1 Tax=Pseudomonas umsongensis TaxID=198618 RepID=UPI00124414BC|nr:heme utilization protein [Pseudomonas umsongensis]QFG29871.1 heme utilization protein [Pseudomonas umsongensis]